MTAELSSIRSKNEIGAFADQFSSLAMEMDRYTKEMAILAGEKERVATELNVATSIQMQMLPHVFPENEKFKLNASSVPAKEVGGDFYDCYMIDDDHLALTIADVSGKGVPAALFMAVSKTMIKNSWLPIRLRDPGYSQALPITSASPARIWIWTDKDRIRRE